MNAFNLILLPLLVFGLTDLFLFTDPNFIQAQVKIGDFTFNLPTFATISALITAVTFILSVAVISGLQVFGSGLNTTSVETILKTGFLLIVFMALCLPSALVWFEHGGFFGQIFVIFMAISYVTGAVLMVRGGG